MTKTRWWMLACVIVAAAAAVSLVVPGSGLEVDTALVTRGTLRVTVDNEGRTRLRDRYVVAAPVAGRIDRLTVKDGAHVIAGQEIGRVFPTPADARTVAVARGQLASAEATRAEARSRVQNGRTTTEQRQRDLTRAASLVEGGALSRQAFEQATLAATEAERQFDMQRAALRAAEAQVAAARAALIGLAPGQSGGAAVTVTAPTAGRVLRVLQQSARVVAAGTPLVEIGDAAGLEVVIDVLSEDAVRIAAGNAVLIDQWGGDETLEGRVRLVEPEAFTKVSALGVEEQRVNVIVDLAAWPARLGAGYRVEAHVVTWAGDAVLHVPASALFQTGGSWAVFAVEGGKAVRRTVQIGQQSAEAVEIVDGLDEGETVILYPSALIDSGTRVTPTTP